LAGTLGIYALVAGRNVGLLAEQIAEFKPKVAVVADDRSLTELRAILKTSAQRFRNSRAGPRRE